MGEKHFMIFSWIMVAILSLLCFVPLFYGIKAPIILNICLIVWDIMAIAITIHYYDS